MLQFLASLAILVAAQAPSPEAVKQASERAYEQANYQRDLPTSEKPKQGLAGKKLTRRAPPERSQNSTLGAVTNMLFWALTFVVIAIFALWFVREFLGYVPDAEAELEASVLEDGTRSMVVSAPLQDARQLAQRRLYGEAIHALLLRTLMELSKTYAQPLAPSLTSREILGALRLPEAEHDALTGLIQAVEHCHFRGTTPNEQDYTRCLGHFEVFVRAYVQERAA